MLGGMCALFPVPAATAGPAVHAGPWGWSLGQTGEALVKATQLGQVNGVKWCIDA